MNQTIHIAIVDDHDLFLRGIGKLFQQLEDVKVLASFKSAQELIDQLPHVDIDLLLLDVQLPDCEPEDLLVTIRKSHPALPIAYITMMRGVRQFRSLEKHGIQGYLLKDSSWDDLQEAIRTIAKGGTYFSEEIKLNQGPTHNNVSFPKNKLASLLSPREIQIMELICKEFSNAEIAKMLYLSTSTIDTHRKNILKKIGVSNTVGLVKFAMKHGIFQDS